MSIAAGAIAALAVGTPALPASAHRDHSSGSLRTVATGFDGPRGVSTLGHGMTLVTETDGTFSLVVERRHGSARVVKLGQIKSEFAPAIDVGPDRQVWILTTGAEPGSKTAKGAATLYTWKPGWKAAKAFADIGKYQAGDPDPYDLEKQPTDSNPFGVEALRDGSVLVADAGGNDLLRVSTTGSIETVARLKPRVVAVPKGLPAKGPDGKPLPKAGTKVPSEAVATSVTVGADGYWYVGELRGFPATPGTSQIWRIKPGSVGAVCDPAKPYDTDCSRYADGLTSIVDLAADSRGSIYAVELSKLSWLAMEMKVKGSEVGGLFKVSRYGYDRDRYGHDDGYDKHGGYAKHRDPHGYGSKVSIRELVPNQLKMPSGVDVGWYGDIYLTQPIAGPGALMKIEH